MKIRGGCGRQVGVGCEVRGVGGEVSPHDRLVVQPKVTDWRPRKKWEVCTTSFSPRHPVDKQGFRVFFFKTIFYFLRFYTGGTMHSTEYFVVMIESPAAYIYMYLVTMMMTMMTKMMMMMIGHHQQHTCPRIPQWTRTEISERCTSSKILNQIFSKVDIFFQHFIFNSKEEISENIDTFLNISQSKIAASISTGFSWSRVIGFYVGFQHLFSPGHWFTLLESVVLNYLVLMLKLLKNCWF